jgi:hypothetical protein
MFKKLLITLSIILRILLATFAAKVEAAETNHINSNEFVYDADKGLLLDTIYTNVTFIVIDKNANVRIHEKSVMNDCFNPQTIANCSGSFKRIKLPTEYGVVESLVFERIFPRNKVIYNLASLGSTYYTKVETPSGDIFIHPFDIKTNVSG